MPFQNQKKASDALRENSALISLFSSSYYHSQYYATNKFGGCIIGMEQDGVIGSLTQLFINKELWCIDNYMATGNSDNGYLPSGAIEREFNHALANYIKFYQDVLSIPAPIKFIAGFSGIRDYTMAITDGYAGHATDNDISYANTVNDYSVEAKTILKPFYEQLWNLCDLNRPDSET
jgi:hypothetical protein